ncbi:hypothetical protein CLAIMM_01432 [Cladophialophora immunda]|nr:hypothetical protein CLAIMM_01432 [Cladophialophora immunda]
MAKIVFVHDSGPNASRKDRELARSEARSHAARVSHRGRKRPNHPPVPRSQNVQPAGPLLPNATHITPLLHDEETSASDSDASPSSSCSTSSSDTDASIAESAISSSSSILGRGNSDPFEALPIPVNSRTNQILSFLKNVYLPSIYRVGPFDSETSYGSLAARAEWSRLTTALYIESSGLAVLYKYLSIMPRSRALRMLIERAPTDHGSILEGAMNLFSAEMFAGDPDEASIHGKMIHSMLKKSFEVGGAGAVSQEMLRRAIYNDVYLAMLHMRRPIFSMDGWVLEYLAPILAPVDEAVEPLKIYMKATLDDSIDTEPAQSLLVVFRLAMAIWFRKHFLPPEFNRATAVQWVFAQTNMIHVRALNHYLDMHDRLDRDAKQLSPLDHHILDLVAQCCLVLGIMYYIPQYSGDPTILDKPILGCTKVVMKQMRQTMLAIFPSLNVLDPDFDPSLLSKHANTYLWALFLGAQAEQTDGDIYLDASSFSLSFMFREFALRMRISSWSEIQQRTSRYVDHEWFDITPHASLWVPQLLEQERGSVAAPELELARTTQRLSFK